MIIPEVNERTKAILTISLTREDGTLYSPAEVATITYRIDDAETGASVVPSATVPVTANPFPLTISADVNRILDPARRREVRRVTIVVPDVATAEFFYQIVNLAHI